MVPSSAITAGTLFVLQPKLSHWVQLKPNATLTRTPILSMFSPPPSNKSYRYNFGDEGKYFIFRPRLFIDWPTVLGPTIDSLRIRTHEKQKQKNHSSGATIKALIGLQRADSLALPPTVFFCVFFKLFIYLFIFLSSGGLVKIKLKLTTLPRSCRESI